jgi:hypothetical protein
MRLQRLPLSDEIRQAVAGCGHTRYAISKATGIAESTLSRFIAGERGLPMKTLDKLADYLDLHITAGTRRRTKKGSGNRGNRF